MGTPQRLEGDRKGLHHRGQFVVDFSGYREALFGADEQVFAESPVGGRLGAGAAQHPHAVAEVSPAAPTIIALATLEGRIYHHSLTDGRLGHAVRHGGDFAGDFMAEDERLGHGEAAAAAFLEVMHIRAADAGAADAQQHLPRSQFRHRTFFDTQILDAV